MKAAYNLLWLSPTWKNQIFKKFVYEQKTVQPIKDSILENILHIANQNPSADVRLWIDSIRMNREQRQWLEKALENRTNFSISDLRGIPHYRTERLYQDEDYSNWRNDSHKNSLIWRQVDAAKILVALQGNYAQSFYSDLDITNLVIEADETQRKLAERGLILRGFKRDGQINFENPLFGFNERGREFFESLYQKTLEYAHQGLNGYHALLDQIKEQIKDEDREKIALFSPEFRVDCEAVHADTPSFNPKLFKNI